MTRIVITIDTVEDGPVLDAELVLKEIQDRIWPRCESLSEYPESLWTGTEHLLDDVLGIIEDYFEKSIDPNAGVDSRSEPETKPQPYLYPLRGQ